MLMDDEVYLALSRLEAREMRRLVAPEASNGNSSGTSGFGNAKALTWHICWLERDSRGRSVTRRQSIATQGGSPDAPPQEAIDAPLPTM